KRSFPQGVYRLIKLLISPVKQKPDCSSPRGGIVYYLSHQITITKVELIPHPYFSGRVNQHVPKPQLLIQFPQKKNFNFGTCFFLVAIKPCRKNLGIVGNEDITLIKIIDDVLEHLMFDSPSRSMNHH